MKLGPHLHRIGNDIVAAYLVDTDEGMTVIDAGLPGHWRELLAELAAMGRSLDDIRGVDPHPRRHRPHRIRRAAAARPRRAGLRARRRRRPRARRGQAQDAMSGRCKLGADGSASSGTRCRKGGMRTTYLTEVVEVAGRRRCSTCPAHRAIIGMPGPLPRQHRRPRAGRRRACSSATRSPPATC